MTKYLTHLKQNRFIEGHRIARRKLGFGPKTFGEFHIELQLEDLTQLELAWKESVRSYQGASRREDIENVEVVLYRSFPDTERVEKD